MVINPRKRRHEPFLVEINSRKRKYDPSWQEVAAKAQAHRDTSLAIADHDVLSATLQEIAKYSKGSPKDHISLPGKILQSRDIEITENPPERLVKLLASRELTATEVTRAFLRRAVVAQTVVC